MQLVQMGKPLDINEAGAWYKMFRWRVLSAVFAKDHNQIIGIGLVAIEISSETNYLLNELYPQSFF